MGQAQQFEQMKEAVHILLTREAVDRHLFCERINDTIYGADFNIYRHRGEPNLVMKYTIEDGNIEAAIWGRITLDESGPKRTHQQHKLRTETLSISDPDLQEKIVSLIIFLMNCTRRLDCDQGPKQSP